MFESPLEKVLRDVYDETVGLEEGEVASYIPELAKAKPEHFSISLVTTNGHLYHVGDSAVPFTIQSISKPFVYGLALDDLGVDRVLEKVDVEPSGEAFNAISLEPGTGRPRNPLINAGAITSTSLIQGPNQHERLIRMLTMFAHYVGHEVSIDHKVFESEKETGHRNRAIGHMLRNAGILTENVDDVLDLYFTQCSLLVTGDDLAVMAATLANNGCNPITGDIAVSSANVERVLSVMSTCGMYDAAGSWVYRVGLPAKSGVGGGVIAVLPGQLGISVFSPRLDRFGNSVRGVAVCETLSRDLGLHLLRPPISPSSVIRAVHSLGELSSKRQRRVEEVELIRKHGDDVKLVQLQGPVVFSNAEVIFHEAAALGGEDRTIVFDFKRVDAMDPAVPRLFAHFSREAVADGGEVLFSELPAGHQWRQALERELYPDSRDIFFQTTDLALEHCEDQILARENTFGAQEELPLSHHPFIAALTPQELEAFGRLTQRRVYGPGERIVSQGDDSGDVFMITSGVAGVSVRLDNGGRHRVATLGSGTTFGELALLGRQPRTADIDSETALVCYTFNPDSILENEDGLDIRGKLFETMARDLASRLRQANREISALAT